MNNQLTTIQTNDGPRLVVLIEQERLFDIEAFVKNEIKEQASIEIMRELLKQFEKLVECLKDYVNQENNSK